MLLVSFQMFSSEQECKDLVKELIRTYNLDSLYRNGESLIRAKIFKLQHLLSLYPDVTKNSTACCFTRREPDSYLCEEVLLGSSVILAKVFLSAGADPNYSECGVGSLLFQWGCRASCYQDHMRRFEKNYILAKSMIKLLIQFGGNSNQKNNRRKGSLSEYISVRQMLPDLIEEIEIEIKRENNEWLAFDVFMYELPHLGLANEIGRILEESQQVAIELSTANSIEAKKEASRLEAQNKNRLLNVNFIALTGLMVYLSLLF